MIPGLARAKFYPRGATPEQLAASPLAVALALLRPVDQDDYTLHPREARAEIARLYPTASPVRQAMVRVVLG